ncbi:MAG TPA: NAD-dependent epimerase/dehydratase family protein [Thermoleophilaceae bacterium]|nr:NAD-dependent epimerase/dehydratase family protein [Thermoleophilaceae bacterium]
MRSLVTGGAGFIGSNLVDALVRRGDEVTVLDDLSTGRRENLKEALSGGARLEEVDVRDAERVRAVVDRARPEAVFHLAAQIDVRRSASDPAHDARINVEGTINVLGAAHAAGVRRFVNTSTGGAIYGEGRTIPAPESHPVAPEAPYGQSKFAAEGYCELFRRLHGLSTVSLRYGNVYGPRQDPLGEAGVVAIFCGALLAGSQPTVFGDGLQTRDYVHVGDVVDANLLAADSEAAGALNIGCGVQTTVLELVEALDGLADRPFEPVHAPARAGEVRHIALDHTRARDSLGWEPRISVRDGLEQTLDWVRGTSG